MFCELNRTRASTDDMRGEADLPFAMFVDWRMGERRRWAYPITFVTFVAIHTLMVPLSSTEAWLAFCRWFAAAH